MRLWEVFRIMTFIRAFFRLHDHIMPTVLFDREDKPPRLIDKKHVLYMVFLTYFRRSYSSELKHVLYFQS